MPDVDALAVAKAAALAALDHPSSSTARRTKRRRRRHRASSDVQDHSESQGYETPYNDATLAEFEQPSVGEVLDESALTEQLRKQFSGVLRRFGGVTGNEERGDQPVLEEESDKNGRGEQNGVREDEESENSSVEEEVGEEVDKEQRSTDKLSRKQRKERQRDLVSNLKSLATKPEVVEAWDVTAADPVLLVHLKSVTNSVAVPDNWRHKRKYLQGKRGMEKRAFKLPAYIADTGVGELRDAQIEADEKKSLKQKQREKMRAKTGRGVEIDVGRLYDAFFKFQTKPRLTRHGDVYYELRELEVDASEFVPGVLSDELKAALGMEEKSPLPWLVNMQRYGPPPGYPGLKVPGVNCEIPAGTRFGYQVGGWGKPPVDKNGRPIYGDVFGEGLDYEGRDKRFALSDKQKAWLWGKVEENDEGISLDVIEMERENTLAENEQEEEEGDEVGEDRVKAGTESMVMRREDVGADNTEARKGLSEGRLYRVLEQQETPVGRADMMGSSHVYKVGESKEAEKGLQRQERGREGEGEGEKRKREDIGDGKRVQKKQREFKF